MVIKQRAIQAEDKRERYDAILDAAERLLLRSPEHSANMADVADEAELAKGTVYLYFPSKEELLLALHERNIDAFFSRLIELLEADIPVDFDQVFALTRQTIIEPALFLPLASRCFALMDQNLPGEVASAFMERMGGRLQRAGAGLERHFRALHAGDGLVLLRDSYALILGLWQTAGRGGWFRGHEHSAQAFVAGDWNYADELERALCALWAGTFQRRSEQGAR